MKKILVYLSFSLAFVFALVGVSLTTIFAATYFHLTDVKGKIDIASSLFAHASKNEPNVDTLGVSTSGALPLQEILSEKVQNLCRINTIANFGSDNADKIYRAYNETNSETLVKQMENAVAIRLKDNQDFGFNFGQCSGSRNIELASSEFPDRKARNIFPWVNDKETYEVLTEALKKDAPQIKKAAEIANVPSRLLVSPLFVEQWREFTTQRELFKKFFQPLMSLASSTNFSMGVMNIKEDTAIRIESNLKDPGSPFYLGEQYERLLDFNSSDSAKERFNRLSSYSNHSYSYLYGALYLAELMHQWRQLGYPIDDRPEIVATLFNIGFTYSKPNVSPSVGGAEVDINGTKYTFGGLAYEFYYSGELTDLFPYPVSK